MKQKLIEILKALKIFPATGFGEVVISINNGKIVNVKKTESFKIED